MARARGARSGFSGAFETVYGTSPSSGFFRLPFTTQSLGEDQELLPNDELGMGRDIGDPTHDAIDVSGRVTIPINVEAIGFWLKGLFGDPTTTDNSGVYTHVFTSNQWGIPSMSFEGAFPDVPDYQMFRGCKLNSFETSLARKGQLTAQLEVMGQGKASATSSQAGSLTEFDVTERFGNFHGSIKRNGVAIGEVISADISYMNNLDPVESIRADGLVEGLDEDQATCTGGLTARFSSRALLQQAEDETSCSLEFSLERSASEKLVFAVPRVFLPRARTPVEGPRGVQVQFSWQAAQQTDGGPMVTATLTNAHEAY